MILLLLLATPYLQTCSTGCLVCNTDNQCTFCDNTNMYRLNTNAECTKVTIDNCSYINIYGVCQKCSSYYYLNTSTNTCVYIESDNRIDHCEIYSSQTSCKQCSSGYYLSGNTCTRVTSTIAYCAIYDTATTCKQCNNKYILATDKLSCTSNSGINYCASYNSIHCEDCLSDYFYTRNYLYEYFKEVKTDAERVQAAALLIDNREGSGTNVYIDRCLAEDVDNCNKFAAWDECAVCDATYYINEDNKCTVNPSDRINNCKTYSDQYTCIECVNSYYLQSSDTCTVVSTIDFCLTYDGTASDSRCLECQSGYYSQTTACTIRANSRNVSNCATYVTNNDLCGVCNDGYIISSSGLQCYQEVTNCLVHTESSGGIQCTQCDSGYYLVNGSSCARGSVTSCDVYGSSATVCSKCNNGYYLSNESCVAHTSITDCSEYSPSSADTCVTCKDNSFRFSVERVCVDGTEISYCGTYSSGNVGTCLTCKDGYYMDDDDICQTIPINNCTQYNSQTSLCTACNTNYLLASDRLSCIEMLAHIKYNCLVTNLTDSNNVEYLNTARCMTCSEYDYPIDHTGLYACVDEEDFAKLNVTLQEDDSYCTKYDYTGNCIQCVDSRYLLNGQCETSCSTVPYRLYSYGTQVSTTTNLMITGQRRCYTDTVTTYANASALGIDLSQQDTVATLDIIISCKDSTLPVVTLPTSTNEDDMNTYNRYHPIDLTQDTNSYVTNPVSQFPALSSCVTSTTSSGTTPVAPSVQNCQYYAAFTISSTTVYRCIKCNHGYTSVIGTTNSQYYLTACVSASYCRSTQYYGLSLHWQRLVSCHVCNDTGKIPFLAAKMMKSSTLYPTGLLQYSLTDINHTSTVNTALQSVICLEDSMSALGYDMTTSGTSERAKYLALPTNCGLGILNLSVTNGDSTKNQTATTDGKGVALAHFCGACLPGYAPTPLNATYSHIQIKCTAISNCTGKTWFNACSACNSNYVYYSTSVGPIDYTQCIANSFANCFAASGSTACLFCKKGYVLNSDGYCDQITPSYCKSSTYFNRATQYPPDLYSYAMYHSGLGVGCNLCESGQVAFEVNSQYMDTFVCSQSQYITSNNTNFPDTTVYIENCSNYGFIEGSNDIVCKVCAGTYIISSDNLSCFNGPVGCLVSEGPTSCVECSSTRYLVNGLCESTTLSYCSVPENAVNSSSARCKQCQPNYYLTTSYTCERGDVLNCINFVQGNGSKCSECADGYVLLSKNPTDFCYSIPDSANCSTATMTSSSTKGAIFQCTTCTNTWDILSSDISDIGIQSQCLEFQEINECITYDTSSTLDASTFLCTQCSAQYYLNDDGTSCVARTDYSTTCLEYDVDTDNCLECQEGYYVGSTGLCIENPNGVEDCYMYSNESTCSVCDSGYYLSNNTCVEISAAQEVTNCRYYAQLNTCYECLSGYILINSVCETAEAQLCKTYLSGTACATCEDNYVLVENDSGVTSCQYMTKQNCSLISQDGPNYECLECSTGYYADSDGDCQRVTTTVTNCDVYDTYQTCSKCKPGYVLTDDQKTCISASTFTTDYDKNCDDYTVDIECAICEPGYYLQNEQCVACGDSTNCYYCNPLDPTLCLICQPGSYMNSSQKCVGTTVTEPSISYETYYLVSILIVLLI